MRADPVVTDQDVPDPLTLEQWAALSSEVQGEFIDGRLTEAEVPDATHEAVVTWLIVALSLWGKAHRARVMGSGLKYGITDHRGRMADVTVFLDGRTPTPRGVVRQPPDIAVEVISPSPSDVRRDRIDKVKDYALFGVRWYWLIDPAVRTFEVWELRDGVYAQVGAASTGHVSEVPGCPELELDLDEMWREVDSLG